MSLTGIENKIRLTLFQLSQALFVVGCFSLQIFYLITKFRTCFFRIIAKLQIPGHPIFELSFDPLIHKRKSVGVINGIACFSFKAGKFNLLNRLFIYVRQRMIFGIGNDVVEIERIKKNL